LCSKASTFHSYLLLFILYITYLLCQDLHPFLTSAVFLLLLRGDLGSLAGCIFPRRLEAR
jgi:hypothetical protein